MIPLNSKEGVKVSIIKLCRGVIDDIIEKVSSCDDNDTKDFETKPSSVQQQVGVWYQEESLGKGWRTCLISNNGGNKDMINPVLCRSGLRGLQKQVIALAPSISIFVTQLTIFP